MISIKAPEPRVIRQPRVTEEALFNLSRMLREARGLQGNEQQTALNKLADITGLSADYLAKGAPDDLMRALATGPGSPVYQERTISQPMHYIQPLTKEGVAQAVQAATPGVSLTPDLQLTGTTTTGWNQLVQSYGPEQAKKIMEDMVARNQQGTGGAIARSDLSTPITLTQQPVKRDVLGGSSGTLTRGEHNPATNVINMAPAEKLKELGQSYPNPQQLSKTALAEEFAHRSATAEQPMETSTFWQPLIKKGLIKNGKLAEGSAQGYNANPEEARAKLVALARQMKIHPAALKGGFDEWLDKAHGMAPQATGAGNKAIDFRNYIEDMYKTENGKLTPDALKMREFAKSVFQNWAANPVEVKDGAYTLGELA